MNKTVNINLGGMFFHIDEDAYQKMTRYFDAIKRSLSNSNGQDEIIKDIEMRIAEIVTEKQTSDKQVINVKMVDEIITIMGQPEDYRLEDDGDAPKSQPLYDTVRRSKKLYRDTDKGMIGGVATGLGHYFGVDSVWIRLIFIALIFAGGSGFVAYFIFWIATPAAVTTSEKLEMTGEPVNISNIERKVREEFDSVSQKFKNANYDQMGNQVKTGAESVASNIGHVFSSLFVSFAKVLGALITVFAAMSLLGITIALLTLGSTSFVDLPWQEAANAVNYTNLPIYLIGILGYIALAIPFFFLLILGLKLLVTNLKSIGNIAKYTLLAVWLIAVGLLIAIGIKQATEVSFEGKSVQKETLNITATDTLKVKFRFNDFYAKSVTENESFLYTQDENGKDLIYSNDIAFHILRTDELKPYIQIEKKAKGNSLNESKRRAEKIKYGYKFDGNTLIFDNYLLTNIENKYRNQEVEIFLYLPNGIYLKTDKSLENFDNSDDELFNLHFSGDYLYKVEADKIYCLDCPADENEFNDIQENNNIENQDNATSTIRLNEDGILVKTNAIKITTNDSTSTRNNQKKSLNIQIK